MNRIYLTPDGAEHLASLLALEARKCLFSVVRTLEAEKGCTSVETTSAHLSNIQLAENKQNRVTHGLAGLNPVRAENKRDALSANGEESPKRLYITSRDARHPHVCDCEAELRQIESEKGERDA